MDVAHRAGDGDLAGDAVVRLAQPFGRWVKDLLEPQVYPDSRTTLDRPYDVTAWTLGMQMGVTVVARRARPRSGSLRAWSNRRRRGRIIGAGTTIAIRPRGEREPPRSSTGCGPGRHDRLARGSPADRRRDRPGTAAMVSGLAREVLEREVAAQGSTRLRCRNLPAPTSRRPGGPGLA